jgi:(p)ppGpp synthase/HD superfamily hydrolase
MDEAHLVSDPDLIVEALLHDTVEDTHLGHEQIRYVFGPEVTRRVLLMSKLPKAGFRARLEAHGDWHVLAVKVADRIDNNRHMTLSSPEFRAKQVAETKDMYYPLADLLVDRAPPGPIAEGCKVLRKLLRDATQEAERIS